jgi:hypothetical protein
MQFSLPLEDPFKVTLSSNMLLVRMLIMIFKALKPSASAFDMLASRCITLNAQLDHDTQHGVIYSLYNYLEMIKMFSHFPINIDCSLPLLIVHAHYDPKEEEDAILTFYR